MTDVYHADFGYSTDFSKVEGLPVGGVPTMCHVLCLFSEQGGGCSAHGLAMTQSLLSFMKAGGMLNDFVMCL